jgi:hypothetical protein
MDATAPEAAEPHQTAEPRAEPRKRSWRRFKVPTSVVMTFIGIALTAWLLPALTRQWDDRQKARELKASVASDMASVTAKLFLNATPTHTPSEVVEATLLSDWQIESRLRLYFPSEIAGAWELYSFGLHLIINAPPIQMRTAFGKALTTSQFVTRHVALRAATMLQAGQALYSGDPDGNPFAAQWARTIDGNLERTHPGVDKEAEKFASGGFYEFEHAVLELQAAIANEVLAAHLTGYSTTTRDLLNDLLPL